MNERDDKAVELSVYRKLSRREKEQKVERYRHLNRYAVPGRVLFSGSSLMEQFPVNEFIMNEGLPLTAYNRGVGGFTTEEFSAALGPCVLDLRPSALFLNIGTNDLNGPDYEERALLDRYDGILERIQAALPDCRLYLLAYYPCNPDKAPPYMAEIFRHRTNERIRSANLGVRALAEARGGTYLDLNGDITDGAGRLKEAYTFDGMHMYAEGYRKVFEALLPVLRGLSESV